MFTSTSLLIIILTTALTLMVLSSTYAIGKTAAKKVLEDGSKTLIRIATDQTEKTSMRVVASARIQTEDSNAPAYDLQGRQATANTRGIVVQDGVKTVK